MPIHGRVDFGHSTITCRRRIPDLGIISDRFRPSQQGPGGSASCRWSGVVAPVWICSSGPGFRKVVKVSGALGRFPAGVAGMEMSGEWT